MTKLEKDQVYILAAPSVPYPWSGAVYYRGEQDGGAIFEIGERPLHPNTEGIQGVFDLEAVVIIDPREEV